MDRQPSRRQVRDESLKADIERVHAENYGVYRARKVWLALRREGIEVARCTVERLMAELGLSGAVRGKVKRTTITDPAGPRPADLVGRQFGPPAPNRLWVADLTYVSTWSGFAYVAFVIDAYARRILGWRVASTMARRRTRTRPQHRRSEKSTHTTVPRLRTRKPPSVALRHPGGTPQATPTPPRRARRRERYTPLGSSHSVGFSHPFRSHSRTPQTYNAKPKTATTATSQPFRSGVLRKMAEAKANAPPARGAPTSNPFPHWRVRGWTDSESSLPPPVASPNIANASAR